MVLSLNLLILLIENALSKKAKYEFLPRCYAEMDKTSSDTKILSELIDYFPKIKIEVEATPITEVIEEESMPIIISQKRYYIIAGAFAEQRNANKMLNKLNRWNYNAEIVEGGNLLRVSYDSFYNRDEAVLALTKIKQENPEAWLLTK